jgi:hypothetical protein
MEKVQEYFEGLGFCVPSQKDILCGAPPTKKGIDFMLSKLSKLGQWAKPPNTSVEFARRWKQIKMFISELRQLERAEQTATNAPNYDDMPPDSFLVQLKIVFVKGSFNGYTEEIRRSKPLGIDRGHGKSAIGQ